MIKTYTFSRSKDLEDIEILSKLKAEKENNYRISLKVDHDDEEESDDDHIIIPNRDISDIGKSSATPLKKLTDLIALTAYDYNPGSNETRFVLANLSKRFRDNNTAHPIVDAILIFAEKEAKIGVKRTVRQWYDTIIAVADKMEPEGEEKLQLKTKVLSLENQVRELTKKLERANALDSHRTGEIDKWHNSYEQAQAEISVWKSRFEEMRDANRKTEYEHQEVLRLKHENAKQEKSVLEQQLLQAQREKQEQLRETEEYKAALAEMKVGLGKSYIRLDTIAECILRLPIFELQYAAYQQINTLLTGTSWSEKAAEVLETMFAKVKEQQDRQEQKQDKVLDSMQKAANMPTTQNILNLELVNKKETNIDKNFGPNIEHNGGTLTLPDKDKEQ